MDNIITGIFPELINDSLVTLQFAQYYDFLVKKNEVMNLTSITDRQEVYYKHFVDSLLLLKSDNIVLNSKLVDIGSGAGFPGIVLKIVRPDLKLTIVEALQKRCNFLQELVDLLKLTDVEIIHARAENYSYENNEVFDYAVNRAVAPLSIMLELSVRMVKVEGKIICYKGPAYLQELANSKKTQEILSLKLTEQQDFNFSQIGERHILHFKKVKSTLSLYPRSYSQIKKYPLG